MPLVAERLREGAVISGAMAITAFVFALYPFMDSALTMGMCSVMLGFRWGLCSPWS